MRRQFDGEGTVRHTTCAAVCVGAHIITLRRQRVPASEASCPVDGPNSGTRACQCSGGVAPWFTVYNTSSFFFSFTHHPLAVNDRPLTWLWIHTPLLARSRCTPPACLASLLAQLPRRSKPFASSWCATQVSWWRQYFLRLRPSHARVFCQSESGQAASAPPKGQVYLVLPRAVPLPVEVQAATQRSGTTVGTEKYHVWLHTKPKHV